MQCSACSKDGTCLESRSPRWFCGAIEEPTASDTLQFPRPKSQVALNGVYAPSGPIYETLSELLTDHQRSLRQALDTWQARQEALVDSAESRAETLLRQQLDIFERIAKLEASLLEPSEPDADLEEGVAEHSSIQAGNGPSAKKSSRRRSGKSERPVDTANQANVTPLDTSIRSGVRRRVYHRSFEYVSALAIFANALLLGIQIEYEASGNECSSPALIVAQFVFASWFVLELGLRIVAEDHIAALFYANRQVWYWIRFDILVILSSIVDLVVSISSAAENCKDNAARHMTVLRIVRAIRVLRLAHSLRLSQFRELRMLLYSLYCAIHALVWSLCLLLFVMYTFAIFFTGGATDYMRSCSEPGVDCDPDVFSEIHDRFSSFARSIITLYEMVTGGREWGDVLTAMWVSMSWIYSLLLVCFISFAVIAMLNIVTAVFVESAMESAQNEKENKIKAKLAESKQYTSQIRALFKEMDHDGSGFVSREEFDSAMNDQRMLAYLEALELDVSETERFFDLIDLDDTGELDIEEFVTGCLKLKGEAKCMDVQNVYKQLYARTLIVEEKLDAVVDAVVEKLFEKLSRRGCRRSSQMSTY